MREASVTIAQEHMESASPSGDDVGRWGPWVEKMRKYIPQLNTAIEVLRFAQCELPFTHLEKTADDVIFRAYYMVMNEFRQFKNALEHLEEHPDSCRDRIAVGVENGKTARILSNMFLWHLRSVFAANTWCEHTSRVLEIGGGYGAFARLWLMANLKPCNRYVIVDLPESLFFAEVCLRTVFADDVGYFTSTEQDVGHRILLVPAHKLGEYKGDIDLVINIGSFAEMSPDWVQRYMDWIDTTPAKSFYSLNYMGSPLCEMTENRNYWSPKPSRKWTTTHINADPPLVKMFCVGRSFAEVIYERRKAERAKLSRQTYVEALESIREHPEWAVSFFDRIVRDWHLGNERFPKELIAIFAEMTPDEQAKRAEILTKVDGYLQ